MEITHNFTSVNWNYTIDVESDEPIMLINKHIGFDSAEGQGVDGSLFQEELLRLDTLGKKRIQVWINSEGGIVMDGYKIYSAILKSRTKVDTYNVGICASIAAVIFQAGRRRIMADYSLLMYHNPYGGQSSELLKMRDSIAIMISERTGSVKDSVLKMMDRTTWIGAAESLASGFCDEVEYTKDNNMKHGNAKAMWEAGKDLVNSISKPNNTNKMSKVANKLGLNPEANEEAIISEISSIVNKNADMEAKMKKMEAEYKAAQDKCNELQEKMNEMKDKMKEAEDKAEKAENGRALVNATNMVDTFVKAGKIKVEAANVWVEKAVADFDGVKNLLETLPTNGKAPIMDVNNAFNEAELTMVAARSMQEVRTKLNIN